MDPTPHTKIRGDVAGQVSPPSEKIVPTPLPEGADPKPQRAHPRPERVHPRFENAHFRFGKDHPELKTGAF